MAHSRLNRIFRNMKQRCYNPNCKCYKDYGGRGITICDEWLSKNRTHKGFNSFREWALSHGYQDGLTIDRIDNNKCYSPDNCRWVSMDIQCNNTRQNHYITYNGKTQSMKKWSEELGISYSVLRSRLNNYHWSVKEAFSTKIKPTHRLITYHGKTQSLTEWCKELNLNYATISGRINNYHWTIEKAFETP